MVRASSEIKAQFILGEGRVSTQILRYDYANGAGVFKMLGCGGNESKGAA